MHRPPANPNYFRGAIASLNAKIAAGIFVQGAAQILAQLESSFQRAMRQQARANKRWKRERKYAAHGLNGPRAVLRRQAQMAKIAARSERSALHLQAAE